MTATMARVPAKPFSWGLISTCCPRRCWPARIKRRNNAAGWGCRRAFTRDREGVCLSMILPKTDLHPGSSPGQAFPDHALVLGLRTDDGDHAHPGRIDQHDLVVNVGELVQ